MKLLECIQRVERFYSSDDNHCRFINVDNSMDYTDLVQHFNVDGYKIIRASDFSKKDELVDVSWLLQELKNEKGKVILMGVTTCLKMMGRDAVMMFLSQMAETSFTSCKVVVVCHQCSAFLDNLDRRTQNYIYIIQGELDRIGEIAFVSKDFPDSMKFIDGLNNVTEAIEFGDEKTIYVKTEKKKEQFNKSLIAIKDQSSVYNFLCEQYPIFMNLEESFGSSEQWLKIYNELLTHKSLENFINTHFGGSNTLEIAVNNWNNYDDLHLWYYFISLKMYGVKNNKVLAYSIQKSNSVKSLIHNIYRCLLEFDCHSKDYWDRYKERKNLLKIIGFIDNEIKEYCVIVDSKGKDAIRYLTDSTMTEKEMIFKVIEKYSSEITHEELMDILSVVYPDLHMYLLPYKFKSELLTKYFIDYKYQKVFNHIYPEFMYIVETQAEKREYGKLLPYRSELVEGIEVDGAYIYFMDAMGVEFLSFINEKCIQKGLSSKVNICRCELPSLTYLNKEFIEEFKNRGAKFIPDETGVKDLDEVKHHGTGMFDYQNTKVPIHLSKELEIIEKVLDDVKTNLVNGHCKKAIMISDHGASRLAVIRNKENKWAMLSKGVHSGRCCPSNEIDEQPTCATEENGHWVLANYDRFQGGRKANCEVHGGATLEEVVIPIIELAYSDTEVNVEMITKEIVFDVMKKDAVIQIYVSAPISDVVFEIDGNELSYVETDNNQLFKISLPDLRKEGEYSVRIISEGKVIASDVKFIAKKRGMQINDLF